MAKLGVYYGLCPIIDHRSMLGICEDFECGNVVATLGKNICVKYKVSNQKQLISWRTKDKFSSPVLCDKASQKYVAAFNHTFVKLWDQDVEDVDRLKKYKFKKPIYTLLSYWDKTIIIFKNGNIISLSEALKVRKEYLPDDVVDEKSEYIIDVLCTVANEEMYVGLLTCEKEDESTLYFTWNVFGKEGAYHKLKIKRDKFELKGYVCISNNKDEVELYTLWSDGRMYTYNLTNFATTGNSKPELFAVIESVSCKHHVTMTPLNKHYIAMYGANSCEEGATVIIYNLQFRVTQSRQSFKLFTNGARLWCIENNLFLCVGQNLAVVPFKLDMEQLASLVGSHKLIPSDENEDVTIVQNLEIASWQARSTQVVSGLIPAKINEKVSELALQGLAENQICEQILPEFLEKSDVEAISSCLEYFYDIPELYLSKLLKFCVSSNSELFKNHPVHSQCFPSSLQPLERCTLVDKILTKSFSDVLLLPHLRNELGLNDVVLLIQYITYLLSEDGHYLPSMDIVQTENKLIEWSCVILDANYQKFLLSRDTTVKETLILLLNLVSSHLSYICDLKSVAPLLSQLIAGKKVNKISGSNAYYSIEAVSLY